MAGTLYKQELAAALRKYETACREIRERIPSIDAARKLARIWEGDAIVRLHVDYGVSIDVDIKLSKTQTIAKDVLIFLDEIQELGFETGFTGEDVQAEYLIILYLRHKTLKSIRLCINADDSGCKKIQVDTKPVYQWKC